MSHSIMGVAAGMQGGEGLTLKEVLQGIPTDPASIFVYLLLLAGVAWVILGSRGKMGKGKPGA